MILKEQMLGNIQSNQTATVIGMGAQTTQKSGSKNGKTIFDDILGNQLSNIDTYKETQKNDLNMYIVKKDAEPAVDRSDNRSKYLTFREANEKNLSASSTKSTVVSAIKLKAIEDSQSDKVEEELNSDTAKMDQPHNMLHIFAQVLGLDIRDLQKLLKDAGITSESFNNMQNAGENTSRLSQLLGLNSEQEDTLVKMLQLTGKTLDASLTTVQTKTDDILRQLKTKTLPPIGSIMNIIINIFDIFCQIINI